MDVGDAIGNETAVADGAAAAGDGVTDGVVAIPVLVAAASSVGIREMPAAGAIWSAGKSEQAAAIKAAASAIHKILMR